MDLLHLQDGQAELVVLLLQMELQVVSMGLQLIQELQVGLMVHQLIQELQAE